MKFIKNIINFIAELIQLIKKTILIILILHLSQRSSKLYRLGWINKAVTLAEQALELALSLEIGDNPLVASSLNNLAFFYTYQGKLSQAELLLQQALAMLKRFFEGDHYILAFSLNGLAEVYRIQGKLSQNVLPPLP
ncbi:tetratricopeptide repeat protein [Planktothrix mougeotii]|uniref:Tetratricopeptide repeat protein n=1 Tax=Planktothrix mougeotii LEGE 06226 TaxID=1828728 RepID=A0ABR9UBG0_9CYAN|nr:tetratricopeptide repeat protein [Planktothrix mougeotii]MBE9143800.1 tetratricopeptide repeat protein [Planktothrix mougeotii LEGE 06226]